jgi:hypothetical protein
LQAEAARVAAIQAAAAAAARQPPPIVLNDSVAQSAAVYLAYTRDMATIRGGFSSAQAVHAALQRGAAADPNQISRGLVAYATILALQSPEFVAGVRQVGNTPEARIQMIDRIVASPAYASTLPGADSAAGLVMGVLEADLNALGLAADSVESDAYNIQSPGDQRSGWARTPLPDREGRHAEMVLGLDTLDDYVARSRNFGTTVGRYAGRIENVTCALCLFWLRHHRPRLRRDWA